MEFLINIEKATLLMISMLVITGSSSTTSTNLTVDTKIEKVTTNSSNIINKVEIKTEKMSSLNSSHIHQALVATVQKMKNINNASLTTRKNNKSDNNTSSTKQDMTTKEQWDGKSKIKDQSNTNNDLIGSPWRHNTTTVHCKINYQEIDIYFTTSIQLNDFDNKDIEKNTVYWHFKNLNTNQQENFKRGCNFSSQNTLRCSGWNWRTIKIENKYRVWLTQNKDHDKDILWESNGDFNPGQLMFGCTDHNLTWSSLKISKTQHSSVTLEWKSGISSNVFEPRFDVFVNGEPKGTIRKCGRSCSVKLYGFSQCKEYKICLRRNYTYTYLNDKTRIDYQCLTKKAVPNCTTEDVLSMNHQQKSGNKLNTTTMVVVSIIGGVLLIGITIHLSKYVMRKLKLKGRDIIEPRNEVTTYHYTSVSDFSIYVSL